MTESITLFFTDLFGGLSKELVIFLISLMPILELRGGLIAASLLNVEFVKAFIICYIGNILPIPFILLFIRKVFDFLKKFPKCEKIITKLENKTMSKSDKVQKLKYLGLFLFVAIPLPGTGGWTGALLAILLGMDRGKSFITIALGVLTAGIIMSILSYGILGNLI